jgi:soluble lytic murein transglycosylase
MAASKLGVNFVPEKTTQAHGTGKAKNNPDMEAEIEFILGFFFFFSSSFGLQYILERENELPPAGLRNCAEVLAAAGFQQESLNLISRYTRREDYVIDREDLYLFYPRPFQELIEKYAREAELGAEILYGLVRTESYFMPDAVSRSGAIGLTQLMSPTAADMAGRIARQGGNDYRSSDGIDLKDPEKNIHIGSYYLKYLTGQMGNPMLALLAYNGGLGRVRRWLAADRQRDGGLPPDLFLETIDYAETREYGRRVLAAAAVYGYLYYGMSMEDVAANIYSADIYR